MDQVWSPGSRRHVRHRPSDNGLTPDLKVRILCKSTIGVHIQHAILDRKGPTANVNQNIRCKLKQVSFFFLLVPCHDGNGHQLFEPSVLSLKFSNDRCRMVVSFLVLHSSNPLTIKAYFAFFLCSFSSSVD